MRNPIIPIILIVISALSLTSCTKDNTHIIAGEAVEIYLLSAYEMEENKCKLIESSIVLEDIALILNDDIVSYILSEHKLVLTDDGINKIKEMSDWDAFSITVNKEIIYSGICKPGYSSSVCDHSVTIDPLSYRDNEIKIRLGYPWASDELLLLPDPRENELLIETFRAQGKLR